MDKKENNEVIDVTKLTDDELKEIYSKISENIMMMNDLLSRESMEEAIKKYHKIKNKV